MTGQEDSLTPIRKLNHTQVDGCRVLSRQAVAYLEGSEDQVLEIIRNARDLSSLSDELELAASNWFERYNLSKSRANILRPLALRQEDVVLEVGAGCGAVTRYLGETCRAVDALEPVPARARVARERTRDLSSVEVLIGGIDDLPSVPAYDVIVLVGVLEYSGEGSADLPPYADFLHRLAALLRPNGHIVCAIENQLGVKYLAGAPENHTSRVFDGLEGYPRGAHVRTFSRPILEQLFRRGGLHPRFLHTFPDYHMARLIFSDALLETPEGLSLAASVPSFPSPDSLSPRPHLASERHLWHSLLTAGLGHYFSNAFLVVGSLEEQSELWNPEMLAAFYSTYRKSCFATETRVSAGPTGIRMARSFVSRIEKGPRSYGPLTVKVGNSDYIAGIELIDLLASADEEEIRGWMRRWRKLLRAADSERAETGAISIDIGPHHMVVQDTDKVALIDQEMWHADYGEREVLERQLLWLGVYLANRTFPQRWQCETVAELVRHLGQLAGVPPDGDWIEQAAEREAPLQAMLHSCLPEEAGWDSALQRVRSELAALLGSRLEDGPLGLREHELRARAEARLNEMGAALAEKDARITGFEEMVTEKDDLIRNRDTGLAQRDESIRRLRAELEGIQRSRGYRLLQLFRRLIWTNLPFGARSR